jgi:hypothetical protein
MLVGALAMIGLVYGHPANESVPLAGGPDRHKMTKPVGS